MAFDQNPSPSGEENIGAPHTDLQKFYLLRHYVLYGKMSWQRVSERKRKRLINEEIVTHKEAGDINGKRFPFHDNLFVSRKTFQHVLFTRFSKEIHHTATSALRERRPRESAAKLLSSSQSILFAVLAIGITYAVTHHVLETLIFFNVIATTYFICIIFFRAALLLLSPKGALKKTNAPDMPKNELPIITILLPLYNDAASLPALSRAIDNLDYPKQKKDIKLLLEADDPDTIGEAKRLGLDDRYEIIIVRNAVPKTKPKACNYGLQLARGELIVIYDAEDQPESDQLLKAAAKFYHADEKLTSIQARLNYYNAEDNWLTRLFTLEYSLWFDWLLPALQRLKAPIPLGGTSNFFRTNTLLDIGGWDPYNVTEDADLGLRLSKLGYRTEILDSTTFEEANCQISNWIRQRSRWMKGYLQTWLVHMRRPSHIQKTTGWVGLLFIQLFLAGTVFSALINPILWIVFIVWLFAQPEIITALFPGPLLYLNIFALIFGNLFFVALMVIAPIKRGWRHLCPAALTAPAYWLLTSVAGYKAIWQIFTRPHFWEKTNHVLSEATIKKREEALKNIVTE